MRARAGTLITKGSPAENRGCDLAFAEGAQTKPFRTVPTFITDSPKLALILHRNQFMGEGFGDERGLWIRFYELTDKAE